MEKTYWLGRTKTALGMARNATSSIARSIHYDLSRRYSQRARDAGSDKTRIDAAEPPEARSVNRFPAKV